MIDLTKRLGSRIRTDLVDKLLAGNLYPDDSQIEKFKDCCPDNPLNYVIEAKIAMYGGNTKSAVRNLFAIDVEQDYDASWFATEIAQLLFEIDALGEADLYQFLGDLEERKEEVLWDYSSELGERVSRKMREGTLKDKQDPDLRFLKLLNSADVTLNLAYVYLAGSNATRKALRCMENFDCMHDAETALTVLDFLSRAKEADIIGDSYIEAFCNECYSKFYDSEEVVGVLKEICPSLENPNSGLPYSHNRANPFLAYTPASRKRHLSLITCNDGDSA